ncbi:flavonoid glycosyltransferase UGT94C2 [Striga asiatica]|uniref:Flavonoid glycosyltransferase UGT94C2 n=1 Tax=Striga asiatica TaxID=4170 RepID=A0A5A7RGJ9_STRAF|nr:flavonoid glycosyltransferase UGT94C2 [Striga asiatica]
MFPWLAHGHIFPYLELAKRLLNRKNFHIHLCTTAVNFPSIQDFILKNSLQHSIDLVQLHLQPSPELPPNHHTTKNLPSNLIPSLLKLLQTSEPNFSDIVSTLNPDLVIYDVFQPWAARIASSKSIPAVHFLPLRTATTSYVYHHHSTEQNFPFPELHLSDHAKERMDSFVEFLKDNIFFEGRNSFINFELSSGVVLLKTCRALEEKYIDYLSGAFRKKLPAVGPLAAWRFCGGSTCFPSKEEIAEIARGLEACRASFVWVVRFPLRRPFRKGSSGKGVGHGMPMKLNMFVDVKMMVDAGVYVEVERKGNSEGYKGDKIANAINEVIVEKTGERMRGKALELSEKMRVEEEVEMDATSELLWELCLQAKVQKE